MIEFTIVGIFCILSLLVLIGIGVPIGMSFIISGLASGYLLVGYKGVLSLLTQAAYYSIASPSWTCLPLFILMGSFAAIGGFAKRAYKGVNALTYGLPGSLGIATCYACAAFGTISGSSVATTAIFGKLALPEMLKYKYNKSFALGCIASAGTFASMIPPSMGFVIYALFTNTSIGRLFAAGIIPGLITATVYSASIIYRTKKNPKLAPQLLGNSNSITMKERFIEFGQTWPVFVIAFIVLGGIYSGIFTPTEAAAAGCLAVLIFSWIQGDIKNIKAIGNPLRESANTTSMLFLINVGALFFARVIALTRIPVDLTLLLQNCELNRIIILLAVLVIFFFLGMIMVPVGIYALTLPIVLPILTNLGYDPIWFGVITIKLMEIAAITPPVGLNVYVMKGVAGKDTSLYEVFVGIWPFCLCDIIVLILLIAFPQLSLWLPNLIFGIK